MPLLRVLRSDETLDSSTTGSGKPCCWFMGPFSDAGTGSEVVRNSPDTVESLSGQRPCEAGKEEEYVGLLLILETVEVAELELSLRRLGAPTSLDAPAIRSMLSLRIVGASRCAQWTISMSPNILLCRAN